MHYNDGFDMHVYVACISYNIWHCLHFD